MGRGCSWVETNQFPAQPVPAWVSRARPYSGQTQAWRVSRTILQLGPCLRAPHPVKPLPFSWATKAVEAQREECIPLMGLFRYQQQRHRAPAKISRPPGTEPRLGSGMQWAGQWDQDHYRSSWQLGMLLSLHLCPATSAQA